MRNRRPSLQARRGFTLIELLVVIAIIAVLVGLTAAAVMNLFGKGPELGDRSTLTQLDAAVKNFHTRYGFYPPSRIYLAANYSQYNTGNQLHVKSLEYLNTMFRLPPNWTNVDWSGGRGGLPTTLEGDQCLVFFLGGIPATGSVNACLGFNANQRAPTAASGERIKFFEFKPDRLILAHSNQFFSYKNEHGNRPYAYFSSYKTDNGYNLFGLPGAATVTSDCATLGVWPYAEAWVANTPPRYVNSKSYQILSAGADGSFGPGTSSTTNLWNLASGGNAASGGGKDDISNFSDRRLGN